MNLWHWATSYFVKPEVVLKGQPFARTKKQGHFRIALITSSDNFASWGGEVPITTKI